MRGGRRAGGGDNEQAADEDRWPGRASGRRPPGGPRRSARDRPGRTAAAVWAIQADVVIRDGPADHRFRRRGSDRPVERGDHFQRSGRPDRDGPGRSVTVRGGRPLSEAPGHAPQRRAMASPRPPATCRRGRRASGDARGVIMTRFYRAGKGGGTDPVRRRDERESPTTRRAVAEAPVPPIPMRKGSRMSRNPSTSTKPFAGCGSPSRTCPRRRCSTCETRAIARRSSNWSGVDLGADAGRNNGEGVPQAVRGGADAPADAGTGRAGVDAPAGGIIVRRSQSTGHPRHVARIVEEWDGEVPDSLEA